ncbi:MAG: sigma-54 dependent transcriptional regulator [Bryobacterales bacterium]|nr:sigma-54 dependent transcriptional regulator [Bryobacterales bacterium]
MDLTQVIIGQSARMRQVLRMVEKLGRCRWPVLLLGETGTGKEVVARAIHNVLGERPFVTIDCSSMVGPLMESELFGHVKGSFTGAYQSKLGLIEMANGGSAFFDEIGELPLDLQAKLLRVLQQKEFRPVGSLTPRHSDFRIIAASNRDLAREVERGAFRRDLYYRLSVVNLRITPLRDRKEDIPSLIAHFMERYGNRQVLSREALDAILSYDWPGNVRELENCVQHMLAMNSGPLLHTAELPSSVQNHIQAKRSQYLVAAAAADVPRIPPQSPFPVPAGGDGQTPVILPLVELEKRAIAQTLEYTRGDRVMAANLLGIGRTTLYRKIKEYAIAS